MFRKRNFVPLLFCLIAIYSLSSLVRAVAADRTGPLLNEPVDVSGDFRDFTNLYYLADKLADFDPATASGKIRWQRAEYFTRQAFDNMLAMIRPVSPNEFPENEYEANPVLPFSLEFVSPNTVRIRAITGLVAKPETDSLSNDCGESLAH
jgi:alpha-D-xyloside xylohydrolase